MHKIHTHIKDKIGVEVIESMFGQLSDGIWENSPRMERYWSFIDVEFSNGEVVLLVDKDGFFEKKIYDGKFHSQRRISSAFADMSDEDIKKWVAKKIKDVVKEEERSAGLELWDRSCTTELEFMSEGIRAKDAYKIYDALLGRKTRVTESIRFHRTYQFL